MQQLLTETKSDQQAPLKVLIADDHETYRDGLKAALKRTFVSLTDESIVEASTIDETIMKADQIFDSVKNLGSSAANSIVILLDILFNNEPMLATDTMVRTGLSAAQKIWETHPTARIIIVSTSSDEKHIKEMYRLMKMYKIKVKYRGAWGWIPKDKLNDEQLVNAVTKVLNGSDEGIDPSITHKQDEANEGDSLSSDEIETLLYVGIGLTDDAVGANFPSEGSRSKYGILGDRAIQARLRNAYIKLGIKDNEDLGAEVGIFNERCRAVWECLRRGIVRQMISRQP